MRYLIIALVLLVMAGCSHEKYIAKNQKRICGYYCPCETTSVLIKDTIVEFVHEVFVEPDTSTIRLYIECDSLNQVLITKVDKLTGNRTDITYDFISKYNKAMLTVNCYADSIDILHKQIKEIKAIDKTTVVEKEVPVEVVKYRNTWWLWVLLGISLGLNGLLGLRSFFLRK